MRSTTRPPPSFPAREPGDERRTLPPDRAPIAGASAGSSPGRGHIDRDGKSHRPAPKPPHHQPPAARRPSPQQPHAEMSTTPQRTTTTDGLSPFVPGPESPRSSAATDPPSRTPASVPLGSPSVAPAPTPWRPPGPGTQTAPVKRHRHPRSATSDRNKPPGATGKAQPGKVLGRRWSRLTSSLTGKLGHLRPKTVPAQASQGGEAAREGNQGREVRAHSVTYGRANSVRPTRSG
jgi:hypothetical protein